MAWWISWPATAPTVFGCSRRERASGLAQDPRILKALRRRKMGPASVGAQRLRGAVGATPQPFNARRRHSRLCEDRFGKGAQIKPQIIAAACGGFEADR